MDNKSVENEDVVLKALKDYRLNISEIKKECQSNSISCDEYLGEIFGDKFDKK